MKVLVPNKKHLLIVPIISAPERARKSLKKNKDNLSPYKE
jgi:hypothetical protein